MIVALGIVAALLIGGILGLLGGGGSILATPTLVYLLGVETKASIVGSLVVVGVASLVGGMGGVRRGVVDLRRAALFVAGSIPGSFVGGMIGGGLDDDLQMGMLAAVMFVTAVAMIRRARRSGGREAESEAPRSTGIARTLGGIAVGVGVGMLTGFVGAGGGFMIVPALTLFFAVPIARAIPTSMIVIAVNSVAGLLGYVSDREIITRIASGSVGPLSLPVFLIIFTAVMTTGVLVASSFRHRLPGETLRTLFAYFLILVAAGIVVGIAID